MHWFYSCDKWRMTKPPLTNFHNSVKTITQNTQLIKRQKTEGACNEMNSEMKKNCLKGGWGEISLNRPKLTLGSQFSMSDSKWLQIWHFQPTTLQQNTLCFIQTAKRQEEEGKKNEAGGVIALPSSRKAGGSQRGSLPGPTLESPHKSWFERGANQRR